MSPWVRVVVVVAALKCVSALVAIIASGNTIPAGSLYSTYQYGVLILAYGLSGMVLITTRTRDLRGLWLGCVLLLVAVPFSETILGRFQASVESVATAAMLIDRIPVTPLLPLFVWLFVREFPQATSSVTGHRGVRLAIAVATGVGLLLVVSNLSELVWSLEAGGAGDPRVFLSWLSRRSLYWPLIYLVTLPGLAALGWKARAAAPADRRRVRIFVAGLLIGFVPISLDVLLEAFVPSYAAFTSDWETAIAWLVFASLVAVPFVTSYSVLIDRVVEIRLVVRSALQYALARYTLYALIAVPLAAMGWYLYRHRDQTVMNLASGAAPLFLAATVAGAAVMLRVRHRALNALDRRFFREQYDARRILNDLADRCRRATTIDELVLLVCRDIDRALHLDSVTMLVATRDGSAFRSPDGRIRPLSRSTGLALLAQGDAMPFVVDLEQADATLRRLPEEERHWLADSGFGLLVPLNGSDGSLLGLIGLGHKRSELPYSREDQLLLEAIGSSVALTVENRRLRESGSAPGLDRPAPAARERRADDGRPASECEECGRVYPADAVTCDCGHALGPALVPYVLSGKFQFDSRLGRGGMGVVYRALDLDLGRLVAIKTLPHLGPESGARLRREAKAMALVQHENLAVIFGAETWLGTPMIVVELLAGGTLSARVRKGPVPVLRALEIGIAVARGIDYLHRAGVLHGDIKPSNIGFTRDDVPKILDFGLATILRYRLAGGTTTTRSGDPQFEEAAPSGPGRHDVAGTPLYMCPEALVGHTPRPAFDVWGLSVVLFEALAGAPPYRGTSFAAVAAAITRGDRPDLRAVCPSAPAPLSVFFDRALSRRPADRPQTAAQMAAELSRLRESVG